MHLLSSLLVLIVVARLFGALFKKFKQPEIVGEIVAGIILGPAILGFVEVSPALSGIAELAIFLVVLSAGLEMNFQDIMGVLKSRGIVVALLGFIIPLLAGLGLGLAFDFDPMRTVFIGLCIAITALPVAVRILESFGLLNTDIAKYSVATAIVNDVSALLALGVILDMPKELSFLAITSSIAITGGKLILLALFIIAIHQAIHFFERKGVALNRIPEKIVNFFGNEALFGMVVLLVLIFGSVSENLGFHFVIGAFFGALLIDKEFFLVSRYAELERTIGSVTNGFLGPVFFAYIGLEFAFIELDSMLFFISVIIVSILSKIFAGWLGGRIIGMTNKKSLSIGIILNGRGVMELIIASIALQRGFIGQELFSILVLMGVITTMMTPVLFSRFGDFRDEKSAKDEASLIF